MTSRLWKVTILVGLCTGQTVPARSDDLVFPSRNGVERLPATGSVTPVGRPQPVQEQLANYSPAAGSSSANVGQSLSAQWPPAAGADPRVPTANAQPAQLATPDSNGVFRLPGPAQVAPGGGAGAAAGPEQTVDGTWREDGQFVIINIDGKETRLLKPAAEMMSQAVVASRAPEEGAVHGRLLQGERPLANCHVVMMPIRQEGKKTYAYDKTRDPQTTITDSEGNYFFDHAPAGKYKLTWLPAGTKQWIRRLVIKPDVTVRAGEEVGVKDISFAQSTIN
jgi:hypothetical protein